MEEEFYESVYNRDYGVVYLLVAAGLFVVFAILQGNVISSVTSVADDFVNRMDALSIASEVQTDL